VGERTATGGTSRAPFHTVELEMRSTIPMGWEKRGGKRGGGVGVGGGVGAGERLGWLQSSQ